MSAYDPKRTSVGHSLTCVETVYTLQRLFNQNWLYWAMTAPKSGKRRIKFTAINKPIEQKIAVAIRLGSSMTVRSHNQRGPLSAGSVRKLLDIRRLPRIGVRLCRQNLKGGGDKCREVLPKKLQNIPEFEV
jgi:hypothetical protein